VRGLVAPVLHALGTTAAVMSTVVTSTGEVVAARSPAEFFAENQHIAGFDNPGASLELCYDRCMPALPRGQGAL
jgi:hypothetical protein